MKTASPDAPANTSSRRIIVLTAAFYNAGALVGAIVGQQYYFPSPPMLSYHFVIPDLRYAGAIGGSLAGAVTTAFMARRWSRCGTQVPLMASIWVFASSSALAYIMLEGNQFAGAATLAALLLPWLTAWMLPRRD